MVDFETNKILGSIGSDDNQVEGAVRKDRESIYNSNQSTIRIYMCQSGHIRMFPPH